MNTMTRGLLVLCLALAAACGPDRTLCAPGAEAILAVGNNTTDSHGFLCGCDSTSECVAGQRCGWSSDYKRNVCSDNLLQSLPPGSNPCSLNNGGCRSDETCVYNTALNSVSCTPPPKPQCNITCGAGQKAATNANGGCFCAPTCEGVVCGAGQTCQLNFDRGLCVSNCRAPYVECGGSCVLTQLNNSHCGGCGNICGPGSTCQGGTCQQIPAPQDVTCHGMRFTLAQGTNTNTTARECRGYDIRGDQAWSIAPPTPGTETSAPNGICAATCLSQAGTETVVPANGSAIWIPGGNQDVPRYTRPGCPRLRWHPVGDPFGAGFAWDAFCEQ